MMFKDDAIKAKIQLMEADESKLSLRSSYNVGGMSFTPKEVAEAIRKHRPDFKISYEPDFRQAIADSWPASIDDSVARKDWGLKDAFNLKSMTDLMLKEISMKLKG